MNVLRGKWIQSFRLAALVLWGVGAGFVPRAEGQGFHLSPERMFEVMLNSRECNVYRGALTRALGEYRHNRELVGAVRQVIQNRRNEFEACAVERGAEKVVDERTERLAAEACPEPYEAYVKANLNLYALRQDFDVMKSQIALLKSKIRDDCAGQKSEENR